MARYTFKNLDNKKSNKNKNRLKTKRGGSFLSRFFTGSSSSNSTYNMLTNEKNVVETKENPFFYFTTDKKYALDKYKDLFIMYLARVAKGRLFCIGIYSPILDKFIMLGNQQKYKPLDFTEVNKLLKFNPKYPLNPDPTDELEGNDNQSKEIFNHQTSSQNFDTAMRTNKDNYTEKTAGVTRLTPADLNANNNMSTDDINKNNDYVDTSSIGTTDDFNKNNANNGTSSIGTTDGRLEGGKRKKRKMKTKKRK